MNEKLNRLIDALREELQQYGAMLSLFERQQEELAFADVGLHSTYSLSRRPRGSPQP